MTGTTASARSPSISRLYSIGPRQNAFSRSSFGIGFFGARSFRPLVGVAKRRDKICRLAVPDRHDAFARVFPNGTALARLIGMLEAVLADDSIAVKRYRNVPLDAASRLILATGINEA